MSDKELEGVILAIRNDVDSLKFLSKNLVGTVSTLRIVTERLALSANQLEEIKNNLKKTP